MNLTEQTETLLRECDNCLERYLYRREIEKEPDFFTEVKPHADEYHALLDNWMTGVSKWIQNEKPLYVHPVQIQSLEDMMKQFIVQSFYPKTGKKRFVQSIQSAQYTLKTILQALANEKKGE